MKELDLVALTQDLPELELYTGDVGTIVMTHGDNMAFEVEFSTPDGGIVAVETLLPAQIRPISPGEIAHPRNMPDVVGSH